MSSLSDLLPLPSETRRPNAYDVFGLAPGERDLEKITAAAITTIEHLKSIKDQTDPALWQQAAQMVDQARQILADPKRKAALDAKLLATTTKTPGAMNGSTPAAVNSPAGSANRLDPLAGLLPAGDPLRPITEAPVDIDPAANDMPPGLFGTPIQTSRKPEDSKSVTEQPLVKAQTRSSRGQIGRKKSKSIAGLLAMLVMGLFAVTGLLVYFVFFGPGTIEIVKSGDKITISTEPQSGSTTRVNPAGPTSQLPPTELPNRDQRDLRPLAQQRDPVMGNLLDPRPGASPPGASGLGDSGPGDSGSGNSRPAPPTGSPANQPEPPADLSPAADPGTTAEPDPAPPLPEVPLMSVAEQDEALAKVRELIRRADWKRMKTEAEALTVARLSDRNQSQAEALYEVAGLATYYREGIERAVEELQVGNDFAVTDALRVIVVETGDDLLTIRYNNKNRSFSFNEFPFSLAHKLASFQVPNNPTGQAAQAVYQAVAPKSTDAYREEAIERLAAIDGQVEGADPVRLAETIELIYQSAEP